MYELVRVVAHIRKRSRINENHKVELQIDDFVEER